MSWWKRSTSRRRSRVRVVGVAILSALCVVILPDVASASVTAPGQSTTVAAGWSMAVSCSVSPCGTDVSVTVTNTGTQPASIDVTVCNCAPTSIPGWPTPSPVQLDTANGSLPGPASNAVRSGTTWTWSASGMSGPWRSVIVTQDVGSAVNSPAQAYTYWDTGTAGTTSAPPTTSAPATTTPPGSSSTPPTSTSSAPAGGGVSGCTADSPCIVAFADGQSVTLNAGDIAVNALTDEQWGDILLGLSCLVFFSAAAFVVQLRRGR